MQHGSITISNEFLDAVLRLKCPQGDKDILFAIVRLIKGTNQYHIGLLPYRIAEYLEREEFQIARRLNYLVERNVIRVNRGPDYLPLRVFTVNFNYKEWKEEENTPEKTKEKFSEPASEPTFWDVLEAAEEGKSEPEKKNQNRLKKIFPKPVFCQNCLK